MRLVVICTANRCRSPMAAALLRRRLEQSQVAAEVLSAGFGPSGLPALDEIVEVMAEVGIDLRQHRSRHISDVDLAASDLITVMTRQHAIDMVLLDHALWPRTFPIVDLVRRGNQIAMIGAGETPAQWVGRVHDGRGPSQLLTLPVTEDVLDPVGGPVAAFRRTRDVLSNLVDDLAQLLSTGAGRK